ncbi:MAG: hypothetical protein LBJ63_03200 [Prevotellaceae bacterium]|jgi:hypothetical protein|nr:hypothetical protein [Prevotellaceae bacterium]
MIESNKYNLWFGSLDFVTVERITRLRQGFYSPKDGFQDFVDAYEQWWNETSQVEKEYIYQTHYSPPI